MLLSKIWLLINYFCAFNIVSGIDLPRLNMSAWLWKKNKERTQKYLMQWMGGILKKKTSHQERPELTMLARHLVQMTLLQEMQISLECNINTQFTKKKIGIGP